jgi:two-component system, OmpR family, phosphate regulon sensor histidine kinase PhoR
MKSISSKVLLLISSVLIACVVGGAVFIYSDNELLGWKAFMISFASSFLLFLVAVVSIFYNINQVLNNLKLYRSQRENVVINDLQYNRELSKLNTEIIAWANDRKNEIERLKKLEIYRKEFLGNVSHELRTPVFNIQGYIATLLDGGLEDETINRTYLERCENSVERMISMIDDLEAITQLESGVLTLDLDTFDIAKLANEVVRTHELRATEKGIMLSVVKENIPTLVEGDMFRMRQVLDNLIVNSIKYGKEYGLTKVEFYDTADTITVEVSDNGLGIAPEHHPRLFERFYRVDKSRSRDQGGIGLGLAIVKHIIEAHNQKITVSSIKGEGTTFTFALKKSRK